ncbi:MAG: hypothetical protein JKY81_03560 [Colwellia sp.]|nr:hypothetical protein [Colwellia sp.]
MPHKIEILNKAEMISVIYSGDVTLDERIQTVHELCLDFNMFEKFKLLIDNRKTIQKMTHVEQTVFGRYIASRDEFNKALVAVVSYIEQPCIQEVVKEARKKHYQIQQFYCEKDALNWLRVAP